MSKILQEEMIFTTPLRNTVLTPGAVGFEWLLPVVNSMLCCALYFSQKELAMTLPNARDLQDTPKPHPH